jgi:glycosyltransferase involved in cell wall biosynthesis
MSRGRVVIFGWSDSIHVQRWATGLQSRGYDLRVVSLGGAPIPGVDTVCLPRRSTADYFFRAGEASLQALAFRPDLIHVHYAGGFLLWAQRRRLTPLVVSVWGADIVDLPHNPLYRWIIGRGLRAAVRITATSQFLGRVCLTRFGLADDAVSVIPFGATLPDRVSPLPFEPPLRLCFVKSLRPKYGPAILLRAMARVVSQGLDAHLTMAGAGELRERLLRLAAELSLQSRVVFTGRLTSEQVGRLLDGSHMMLMPSTMASESFGVAALEAAAHARPVIASRVGGVPEVVIDGQTGLLVPPGDEQALADAILELAADPRRREAMGLAGRAFVQSRYVWETSLDLMDDLYQKVLNRD